MRSFERDLHLVQAVPAPVARALADVDRGRGSEGLHLAQAPGLLHQLAARARISSVMTSSALEGVTVPQPRADGILARSTSRLRSRDEQELAGLRDALDHVWQQDWAPLSTGFVLHLHRLLLGHTEAGGGRFKGSDNLVVDRAPDGTRTVRQRVVEHVLQRAPEVFRLADLRAALPGISDGTMRNALDDLRRDGRVVSEGAGRGATWRRLR